MAVINMQTIRYINLLDKASNVKTTKCFVFNGNVIFAVPKHKISKAIGQQGENIRKIQEKLGKKVKIIREAESVNEAGRFLQDVVSPTRFKSLELKDGILVITAGSTQNKASLIGREKRRLEELKKIVDSAFNLDLRVV
jgi:NusA-like KH domain protein